MKCFMVLISAGCDSIDPRPACESVEGEVFPIDNDVCETIQAQSIQVAVSSVLGVEASGCVVEVLPISDFMDAANDEALDIDSYFIGYVYGNAGAG